MDGTRDTRHGARGTGEAEEHSALRNSRAPRRVARAPKDNRPDAGSAEPKQQQRYFIARVRPCST